MLQHRQSTRQQFIRHRRKFILNDEIDTGNIPLDDAVRIFKIIPEERVKDEEQIETLTTFLTEQPKLRKFWRAHNQSNDQLIANVIAKGAVFVDKPFKSSVIFNKGDKADYFYYVLKGSVNIVAAFSSRSALSVVARIHEGEAFGSLGFLVEDGKRKAGAVTSAINTKLLAFPKEMFENIFGGQMHKLHTQHYEIMRKTKVFQSWNVEHLRRLAAITYDKTYMPGSHITLEGKNIDNRAFLYIVTQGEVEMIKSLTLQNKNGKDVVHNVKLATLGVNQVFCAGNLIDRGNVNRLKEKCLSDR
jgi:CRP-like cAMP-binding protein